MRLSRNLESKSGCFGAMLTITLRHSRDLDCPEHGGHLVPQESSPDSSLLGCCPPREGGEGGRGREKEKEKEGLREMGKRGERGVR